MNKYPEKIYAYGWNKSLSGRGIFTDYNNFGENVEHVEYIRFDLVKDLLDKEYKRGICEGENYPIWHTNDKPSKSGNYLITIAIKISDTEYHNRTVYSYYTEDKWFDNKGDSWKDKSIKVLAWMELPTPYKEK